MSLDINTPRGQQSLQDEREAISILSNKFSGWKFIETPRASPVAIDHLMVRDDELRGIMEVKCRYDVNLDQFKDDYGSDWLITYDKIEKGSRLSESLYVPYFGLLYIVRDKVCLLKKIYDNGWCVSFKVERTETQKTTNGGSISRANAYISMSDAMIYRAT